MPASLDVEIEDFSLIMQRLGVSDNRPRLALAVSGGGDSMALALLLKEWIEPRNGELLAFTVDHALRPESAHEAHSVHRKMRELGIAHETLRWAGEKPTSHIQELAREARYRLILEACKENGFSTLAVAHNLEDQAETFWMRLAHGSGLDGLSGIAPRRQVEGVEIIRPLLSYPREHLRDLCRQKGVEWIEDPSNANDKFLRVRLRQFETALAEEGLSARRLSQTIQKLEDARAALEIISDRAAGECVMLHREGYASLKTQPWHHYPKDIQRRILADILLSLSPAPFPPGFDAVEQLRQDAENPLFSGKTLHGCEVFRHSSGEVIFCREPAAVEPRKRLSAEIIWDKRFVVSGYQIHNESIEMGESLEIGALGENGLSILRKTAANDISLHKALERLPFKIRKTLPSIWKGQNLLAVPHVSYLNPAAPRSFKDGSIIFHCARAAKSADI